MDTPGRASSRRDERFDWEVTTHAFVSYRTGTHTSRAPWKREGEGEAGEAVM